MNSSNGVMNLSRMGDEFVTQGSECLQLNVIRWVRWCYLAVGGFACNGGVGRLELLLVSEVMPSVPE
jgi:hypothetical protein